ncbi:MAG: tetratricopeptide repeat protein [Phycisphaerales bacterium]|nr:tetratricopeptide repeat protein [Phycisphaerales bacterium]
MLVALAALLVYANSAPNRFAYDDVAVVRENPLVADAHWWSAWTHPYWPALGQSAYEVVAYRPVTIQTFRWQYQLSGLNPLPFHLFNVLLHAAISAGGWWLARRFGASAGVALFAGLVFAVHPLHTEAVANVVGRGDLLAAGGTLLAVGLALIGRERASTRARAGLWCAAWVAASLALLSKENGIAGLVVVALIAVRKPAGAQNASHVGRRLVRALVPALVIFAGYLLVRYEVCGARLSVTGQRVAVANPLDDAPEIARWLTPPALLGRYVALSISPHRLLCDYSLNVLPPVTDLADAMLWLGIVFLAGCAALVARFGRQQPAYVLLFVGFCASYLPVSNALMLIDTIFAERLWYGPSLWLCIALALGLDVVIERYAEHRKMLSGLGAVALVALAARTMVRNPDWRDTRTIIARDLAEMQPPHRSARLCLFHAEDLLADGLPEDAATLLREAITIYPDEARYHRALGRALLAMGNPMEAIVALRDAVKIDPSRRESIALLEQAKLAAAGHDPQAEYAAARAEAEAHSHDLGALTRWARLAETVAPQDAVEAYRQLTSVAPDNVAHWSGLALAEYAAGNAVASAETYRSLLKHWPDNWNAHTNLALLLMDRANPALYDADAALAHANRAVELAPANWQLRVNLAEVTARCGDPQLAATMFEVLADQSADDPTAQRLYRERARHLRSQ